MSDIEHILSIMRNKDPQLFEIYQSVALGLEWVWQFRNRDYGWGHTPQAESSLETTYWIVKNLISITGKNSFMGTKELVLNLRNQEGFWGDTHSARSTYRHTACALSLMNIMKDEIPSPQEQEIVERSIEWLLEGGDDHGGWGLGEGDPHDMKNTYIIFSTLLELGLKTSIPKIEGTLKWLKESQLNNGAWPLHADRSDDVDIENSVKGFLLMKALGPEDIECMEKLCSFLIKNQNADGGWGPRPGLESAIGPTSFAFKALTDSGCTIQSHPDQINNTIRFIFGHRDEVGFWIRKNSQVGSPGLTSFIINSLYSHVKQIILSVPVSAVFQLQVPSLTGRTMVSRRIKSPVREMAQIIWQLEGEEHYDIFLDSPETENILFTHSRHFVPKEVREDIFQRTQEINSLFNTLQKTGDWTRSGAVDIYQDLNDKMVRLGKGLYFDFVPPSLQKILSTITTRFLMIATNDPIIPWELIYLPEKDTYLGLEFALGRKVLMVVDRLPIISKSYDHILDVLLIGNPSGNLPSSENEVKYIAEKLEVNERVKTKVMVGDEVTRTGLEKELSDQQYDIIHFAGHSFFNPENPNKSYLELARGEAIYASQFSWLFQKGIPSLIFLNACSTAMDSGGETTPEEVQMSGMIRQLMNIGVQSVIGSLWPMHDIVSATIATEFYRNLMHGMTLGESLQSSRRLVHNSFKTQNVGWNGFILYGNPMLRIE